MKERERGIREEIFGRRLARTFGCAVAPVVTAAIAAVVTAVITKDLGSKSLDGCGVPPGIRWQARFAAGLPEKSLPVPILFDGNLGQEQAAARALRDDETVAPDFHRFGTNRDQTGKHAQRNLQSRSFFHRHR